LATQQVEYVRFDNLTQVLDRIKENLNMFREREARYGGNAPLELLNQIENHQQAIALIEQAIAGQLSENELREALQALNLGVQFDFSTRQVERAASDDLPPVSRRLPFEPETVLIPAGSFLLGSDSDSVDEAPQHSVTLPAYRIGLYPITHAQYAEFIKHDKQYEAPKKVGWFLREPPADKLDHPVVGVSWDDSQTYCDWLTKITGRRYRLPTEAEWEKAARGVDGRRYPWGNEWQTGLCNSSSDETTAVTAYPGGASPFGCYDLLGNVQEWTSTLWGSDPKACTFPYPYQAYDGREDPRVSHLHRVYRIHRGGSFRDDSTNLRCSVRGASDVDSKIRWRGFRVVLELERQDAV
jgi:formylglycine-generating enzyme required for sulfatase activity